MNGDMQKACARAAAELAQGHLRDFHLDEDGLVRLVVAVDDLSPAERQALTARLQNGLGAIAGVQAVRIVETAQRAVPDSGSTPSDAASSTGSQAGSTPALPPILAVGSGKGGVGKSTLSVNLAVALARRGYDIGLLDADIHTPSVPILLGCTDQRGRLDGDRIQTFRAHGVRALSMGMMVAPGEAIGWRGPMASGAMVRMAEQGAWDGCDLLIVDMPPGTGDIQISLAQKLSPLGALIVSTPQDLALADARRAMAMFARLHVPVLGLIENMGFYTCPHCHEVSHPFGQGGAAAEAARIGVPFLGTAPLLAQIRQASDAGLPPATGDGPAADAFLAIATQVDTLLRPLLKKAD